MDVNLISRSINPLCVEWPDQSVSPWLAGAVRAISGNEKIPIVLLHRPSTGTERFRVLLTA